MKKDARSSSICLVSATTPKPNFTGSLMAAIAFDTVAKEDLETPWNKEEAKRNRSCGVTTVTLDNETNR